MNVIRNRVIAAVAADPRKQRVAVILSGDTHLFQFLQPTKRGIPVQIIAGNGGTKLDDLHEPAQPARIDRIALTDLTSFGVPAKVYAIARHGFLLIDRAEGMWEAILYGSGGQELLKCRFSDRLPSETLPIQPACQY